MLEKIIRSTASYVTDMLLLPNFNIIIKMLKTYTLFLDL